MTLSDAIATVGLIIATIAAWFAFKAWRHSKRPEMRVLPKFTGNALEGAGDLADFLSKHEGSIVSLHVEVGLVPTASVDGALAIKNGVLVLEYDVDDDKYSATYEVIRSGRSEDLLKRRTVSLILEGAFVPTTVTVRDAGRIEGTLTEVGPIDLAQYIG